MAQKFNLQQNLNMAKAKEKLQAIESKEKDEYISYDLLDPCEWNNEPITPEKIEELKDSIIKNGLIHNLYVFPKADGRYRILSGNTRYYSIGQAIEEGDKSFVKGVRCHVTKPDLSETDQKILMEEANIKQRSYTPEGTRKAIARLELLYNTKNSTLNADGEKISKGQTTKQLAEITGIGERQIRKYEAINHELIPELQKLFDEGKININKAAAYAQYDKDMQMELVSLVASGNKESDRKIEFLLEEKSRREAEMKKELEQLQTDKQLVENTNQTLNQKIDEKDEELNRLNKEKKNLESRLLKQQSDKDEAEITLLKEKISDIKNKEIAANQEKDRLSHELESSLARIAELEQAVETEKKRKVEIKADDIKEHHMKKYELSAMGKDILSKLKTFQLEVQIYENAYGKLAEATDVIKQIKKML